MAVQAQLYSGNYLGLPTMCSLQDLSLNPVLGVDDNINAHLFGLQTAHQQAQFHVSHGVYPSSSSSSDLSFLRMAFPQALDAQMELQRQELECILQSQVKQNHP